MKYPRTFKGPFEAFAIAVARVIDLSQLALGVAGQCTPLEVVTLTVCG